MTLYNRAEFVKKYEILKKNYDDSTYDHLIPIGAISDRSILIKYRQYFEKNTYDKISTVVKFHTVNTEDILDEKKVKYINLDECDANIRMILSNLIELFNIVEKHNPGIF